MLGPNKHTEPICSILFVSATILKRLRRFRIVPYSDLRAWGFAKHAGTDRLFVPALNLLYSMDLIGYQAKVDAFEYLGPA